jgi:RNA recognition motif-containing protein
MDGFLIHPKAATEPDPGKKEARMATKSLYVGNLNYSTTASRLRELFAEFDPADVRIITDKGFGFVDVPVEMADAAIAALNGKDVDGRTLTVNEARPRGDRPSGGGRREGGGGYGGGDRGGFGGGGGGRRW